MGRLGRSLLLCASTPDRCSSHRQLEDFHQSWPARLGCAHSFLQHLRVHQVLRRPKWWILLYFFGFVPFVGSLAVLFVSIIDSIRMAKVFGKSPVFGVGLLLLPFIFYLVLAFGSADHDEYRVVEGELI